MVGTVKAEDIKPGQVIQSGNHWYKVNAIVGPRGKFGIQLSVTGSKGDGHLLAVYRGDDYPVKADEPNRPGWLPPAGKSACTRHGIVDLEHACRAPGETADQFTARMLGEIRDM